MIHLKKYNEGIFGFGKKKSKDDDDADMFYHMFLATKIHRYAKNRIDYAPIVDNKILSDIADMIRTQFDLYKLSVGGINKLYNKGEVYVEVCKEKGGNRKFCFKSGDLFIFRIFIDNKGKECVAFKVNKKFVLKFVENKDKSVSVLPSPPVENKFSSKKVTTDELRQLMLKIKDKNKNKK